MFTTFFCHAPQDAALARELAAFLARGREMLAFLEEGQIRAGQNLISKTEEGLTADVIVVLLSPDSVPPRWLREEWEPVFRTRPREEGVKVASVLCRDCKFPELLRRSDFFDLTANRLEGFRAVKQWLLGLRLGGSPHYIPSRPPLFVGRASELEALRRALGDASGIRTCRGPSGVGTTTLALEFACRYRHDFEQVLWLNCAERGLSGLAGDLAAQVGFNPDNDLDQTLLQLRDLCSRHSFLLVLDNVQDERIASLIPGGRCSVLLTTNREDLPGGAGVSPLEVPVLTEEEALELLRNRLPREKSIDRSDAARELISLLGSIPFALAAAGGLAADPARGIPGLVEVLVRGGRPSTGRQALDRLIEAAIAAMDGQTQRLLAAMSVCSPAGFSLPFAAGIAELDGATAHDILPRLLSVSFVSELERTGARYRLHPLVRHAMTAGDVWPRRHARAARRFFADWQRDEETCEAALGDLWKAFRWALSKTGDEEAWTLARELARLGFSFTRARNRLAESFEFMEQLAGAAERNADRRMLDECAWEQAWILERWNRLDEAQAIHRKRRLLYADQMSFDFGSVNRLLF